MNISIPEKYHKYFNPYKLHIKIINDVTFISIKNKFLKKIGFISFVLDKDLTILFLEIDPLYRHQKLGTFLILITCYIGYQNNINFAFLDDTTKNAWILDKNIYIKLGFTYINEFPFPEMKGDVTKILKYCK